MAARGPISSHNIAGRNGRTAGWRYNPPCFKSELDREAGRRDQRRKDVRFMRARALQLRWLFIDEVSMVSAELLARLELRCREIVRDLSATKYDGQDGQARCFGGLNVCFSGDLWQLPPPGGTFLGEVPWAMITQAASKKLALTIRGQELVWARWGDGVQGVTELTRCERTHDPWLQELQAELRSGTLSDHNHRFLHGYATNVPGSFCQGVVQCQQPNCKRMWQDKAAAEVIHAKGCGICRTERGSKALVLQDDPEAASVRDAEAILPTNAVKYHVNKIRAVEWAKQHGESLRHAIAQDRISAAALREKPDLQAEKVEWLQRHDQDCGSLYGILPLCVGMPVRATDHLDRNRGILRGCRGVVVGWAPEADTDVTTGIWNTLPAAIYVRFQTSVAWTIPPLEQANVYPVAAQRKQWHLDRHRKNPMLRITRRQFPLAPAFAITAHAAQGQTVHTKIVADLAIGQHGDPLTAYVAVTRVTGRNNLAILRPFDASPFQKGQRLGRDLLLRAWRGEQLDWEHLRQKCLEEKTCAECYAAKRKTEFSVGQWKRSDGRRICKECVQRHVDAGGPWQCSQCSIWRAPSEYGREHQRPQATFYRVCITCDARKQCFICHESKDSTAFAEAAWATRRAARRICKACGCRVRGCWTCRACRQRLPKANVRNYMRGRTKEDQNGTQVCDVCRQQKRRKRTAIAARLFLQERRRKVRRQAVMAEVRAEIALRRVAPTMQQQTSPKNPIEARGRATERKEYECPYCQAKTYSSVRTGNVHAAGHCGKQFRVRNGVVARSFTHAPAVARKSAQRRPLEEYESNTRSLMGKCVQQLFG